jgi:hypothetical protein
VTNVGVLGGELVRLGTRHGLCLAASERLEALGVALPEGLAAAARAEISRGLAVKRLTLQVVDALQAEGLRPLLLKGYALALRLYPEAPFSRPSSDVDVLVAYGELERARAVLVQLGLQHEVNVGFGDQFVEHHHFTYAGAAGTVELHFRLFRGLGGVVFEEPALWARARAQVVEGRTVLTLGVEDEFLYLATHAANHGFARASWLVDLSRFIDAEPQLDWGQVSAEARRLGLVVPVGVALWLLQSMLHQPLPDSVTVRFPLGRLRAALVRRLFSPSHLMEADLASSRLGPFVLELALLDSPRQVGVHVGEGALRFARRWWRS